MELLVPPTEDVKKPIWRALAESACPVTPYNSSTCSWITSWPFNSILVHVNVEHTPVYLRRACNVAREVAYRGGSILFVGTQPGLQDLPIDAARQCE